MSAHLFVTLAFLRVVHYRFPCPYRIAVPEEPRATVLSAAYARKGISDDWRYRDDTGSWRRAGDRAVHGSVNRDVRG